MSEPAQAGKTCDLRGIREAVCVHTGKITDSCLAKDCIEDLRVYLTVDSQQTLDCAASAKARYVELLFTQVQVEPVPYSSGYFTVDVTFYYRVIADATLSAGRTNTVTGLAVFSKRLVLFGAGGGLIHRDVIKLQAHDIQFHVQAYLTNLESYAYHLSTYFRICPRNFGFNFPARCFTYGRFCINCYESEA